MNRPRAVVCLAVPWSSVDAYLQALGEHYSLDGTLLVRDGLGTVRLEFRAPDAAVTNAFHQHDSDLHGVSAHAGVVYLSIDELDPIGAWSEMTALLRLVADSIRAGALAAKCDSSGTIHANTRWLQLCDDALCALKRSARASDPELEVEARYQLFAALREAFVFLLVREGRDVYSCGMHLLGKPDTVETLDAVPEPVPHMEVYRRMCMFQEYLLVECKPGAVQEGHVFGVGLDDPRHKLSREACNRYGMEDLYHNPWGYWRLSPA